MKFLSLSKNKFLFPALLFPFCLLAQQKTQNLKTFAQKDLNAYKFDENKYDIWSYGYRVGNKKDTIYNFVDPSGYKGSINYGIDFASRDKKTFDFIENYNVYYTDVVFEKCSFSIADSIAEIEGRISGGWNSYDIKGKPLVDLVEIAVGELKKSSYVVNFHTEYFNTERLIITYKGEEEKTQFPLDTLNAVTFHKLDFEKTIPGSSTFKIRFKVNKNSILIIAKGYCYTHFYNIGEMMFTKQRKKGIITPKKDKNAPRFVQIIENNVQINDPKNQIKKEVPLYYQLTEKAETYILTRQYAKAKEIYLLLAKDHPKFFARDIHNAIRVAVLSRDVKMAFRWSEKLAEKGIELPYFNSKIFNGLRKNPEWKSFSKKYDSICKLSQGKWNVNLKKQINDLLNEDQADYGLENRKESSVLYETTERITDKLIDLLKKDGYPSEEKIGAFTKNDTILIQSLDFEVIIRHAVQQKPKGLNELNELLDKSYKALEFDLKRSGTHRNFPGACFHIYKGNLYISKSCDYNSDIMVKKMVFMFNNHNGFIIDNGNYIVSEYNPENPKEWDDHYENNFRLVVKLTDDWKFYEK